MGLYANGVTWEVDWSTLIAGSPTYAAIAEIVSVDFGGMTADTLDDTVHGDTWRTYEAGLKDGGDVSITVRFKPETHADLLDNVGTKSAHKIAFPKETSSNTQALEIEFDGIMSSLSPAAPHDGLLEASVTLKVSGAPSITDEAA